MYTHIHIHTRIHARTRSFADTQTHRKKKGGNRRQGGDRWTVREGHKCRKRTKKEKEDIQRDAGAAKNLDEKVEKVI